MTCRTYIDRVFEAYDQELTYLIRELEPSEDEKKRQAAHDRSHELQDWIDQNEPIDGFTVNDDAPWESVEELEEKYPEEFSEYASWALDRVLSGDTGSESPPWLMMSFEKVVRNEWLIHFSDSAYSVHGEGFTRGTPTHDYSRLSLSTHFTGRSKSGGFNFAYPTNIDVDRYAKERFGRYKYGKNAVMFQANGVLVHHHGDEEPQVIYVGKTAHNLVYLYQYEGEWNVGETASGRPIFRSEDIDSVIEWVKANYEQYRKSLRARREDPAR